ncbi:Lrp/AsnC family transcriptional regulator [Nesterenkonia halobia]|uniref:Lrp/AsnC family transcriptional regulator n=1 Tax=Nesterenkonia halobia TaxID=37922 RepID=UPI0031D50333
MSTLLDDHATSGRPPDVLDHRILEMLSLDARASVTRIAEELHLSRANAYERIARLRRSGVLRGYTAVIDPRAAGLATAAYVFLTLKQDDWGVLREALADEPAVRHLALVGGQYDAVLLVRTRTVDELRAVIFERIQSLSCVQSSQTALIFDDHAEHRHAVPEE